mmetsp:Transcript_58850/g.162721  ORF Transcript_58850/g.162721 Transcript_58850/m.162721 type:complete len:346 (+) Transcript_58850:467-1504(+)
MSTLEDDGRGLVDDVESMKVEINGMERVLHELQLEEKALDLQEEFALLQNYLHLKQVVEGRDTNFSLDKDELVKQVYESMDEAHREIENLEQEAMLADAAAKHESAKLVQAQESFAQLRMALLIEMAQHQQQIDEMDSQLKALQQELDENDELSVSIRATIEKEVAAKWKVVLEAETARMEKQLESAKAECAIKLAEVTTSAVKKVDEQFAGLMASIQDKLAHERAVREDWESKVSQLEADTAELDEKARLQANNHNGLPGGVEDQEEPLDVEARKKDEFDSLRATVHALWDILEVDSEESLLFMKNVQELASFSPAALALYQREEERLLAQSSTGSNSMAASEG